MKDINMLELQKGLYTIAEGFKTIANAIELTEGELERPERQEVEVIVETEVEPIVEEPVNEVESKVRDDISREELEKLTYRELQKVAKDLNVLATGKKEELVDRLLGEEAIEVVETTEEVVEPEVEEIEEEEVVEETEVVVTKADKIAQALEGYSEEELADVLSSIGESPKGKRQALLAKIVKAVEEGLLEIEVEEDEEAQEEPTLEVEQVEEVEMTVPRQRAVAEVREEIVEMISSGSVSEEQMNDILAYVYAGEEFSPTLPLKEREEMLIEMYMNLVDDEGVSQELETPYEKDGGYACCSKALRKKANGNLECTVCNQEYEIG